jgi:hypothetical protein
MFQRPFAWEHPQVEFLLGDLLANFGDTNSAATALGPLMTYRDEDGHMNIFDGQQRMTTIFLMLLAMRSAFHEEDMIVRPVESALLTEDTFGGSLKDTFHLIPKRTLIHELLEWIYENSGADGKAVHQQATQIYRDKNADLFERTGARRVNIRKTEIGRISACYSQCLTFIQETFGDDTQQAQDFLSHIFHRTQFLSIETFSIDDAMHQFERANSATSSLTAIDLLKNSIFYSSHHDLHSKIDDVWEDIIAMQERSKLTPNLMLRSAYIAGMPNSQLCDVTAQAARGWFREPKQLEFISKDPVEYSKALLDLWRVEEHLVEHSDPWGEHCHAIKNYASLRKGSLDTLRPVVFAAKHLQPHIFRALMKVMESVAASAEFSEMEARSYSQMLVVWTAKVNDIHTEYDLDYFISTTVRDFLYRRRLALRQRLEGMHEIRNSKFTHTLLAKISAHFESKFEPNADVDTLMESFSDLEIDHIKPKKGMKIMEGSEIFRFGNLTLLEKPLNASSQDDEFEDKVGAFQRSRCRLTRQIVQDQGFGKNTTFRTAVGTAPTFTTWNLESIEERQKFLADLVIEAWCLDDHSGLMLNPGRQTAA